jgi:hypothetical protein
MVPAMLSAARALRVCLQKLTRSDLPPAGASSELPLDVMIPAIAKDLPALPLAVASIRRFLRHPIGSIFLVTPPNDDCARVAGELGCTWVDERELLPEWIGSFEYSPRGVNRRGWVVQQLIKLSGDRLKPNGCYLVLDADTVFVRDQVFEDGGRYRLLYGDGYHRPYFATLRRLLSLERLAPVSFIAHHMLFDTEILARMRAEIEAHTGVSWQRAIVDALDPNENSSFSEYETYGNYLAARHTDRVMIQYWHSKGLKRRRLGDLDTLVDRYASACNTVSFQHYLSQ